MQAAMARGAGWVGRGRPGTLTVALCALALTGCGRRAVSLADGLTLPDGPRPDSPRGEPRPLPKGWVAIPPGTFWMGSPPGEPCREGGKVKETRHQVTLDHGLEVGTAEVTQGEFKARMAYNPSRFMDCGAECPVEQVSWHEAAAYCRQLSLTEGQPACYECQGVASEVRCSVPGELAGDISLCKGYRLPTEAEWEYVYRAETETAFYNGAVTACADDAGAATIGWYLGNSDNRTHVVRGKQPNAWGLYDLPGNVWEWCHDWFVEDLGAAPVFNPSGPSSGTSRALRGSSWVDEAGHLRAADRFGRAPELGTSNVGIRCVRTR